MKPMQGLFFPVFSEKQQKIGRTAQTLRLPKNFAVLYDIAAFQPVFLTS
jgi:hypothetical protein